MWQLYSFLFNTYSVTKFFKAKSAVLHKVILETRVQKTTKVLNSLGQVPVVESNHWSENKHNLKLNYSANKFDTYKANFFFFSKYVEIKFHNL